MKLMLTTSRGIEDLARKEVEGLLRRRGIRVTVKEKPLGVEGRLLAEAGESFYIDEKRKNEMKTGIPPPSGT